MGATVLAGCGRGDGPTTPGRAGPAETPIHEDRRAAFRTNVSAAVSADPAFSFGNETWSVSYHYDLCCGSEQLRRHQLELAKRLVAVQPDTVAVNVTTYHECQVVEWTVPPAIARGYRNGDVSERDLADHIGASSERINTC